MKSKLKAIDERLRTMIRVIIWKQWKVSKKREWGLLKLGVEKWIAHKVANWGNHYQFVAQKSVLKRAVSKEMASSDPHAQALWKQITPGGKEPDLDKFLSFMSERIGMAMDMQDAKKKHNKFFS